MIRLYRILQEVPFTLNKASQRSEVNYLKNRLYASRFPAIQFSFNEEAKHYYFAQHWSCNLITVLADYMDVTKNYIRHI